MSADVSETSPVRMLTGECLCGDVRYRVEDRFLYALNCHCSQCRKATGSAFKPFAGIERDKLNVVKGQEALSMFGDEQGHDTHCRRCGSLLYSVVRDGQYVHVTLGTLVDEPSIRPTAHIYVGSKAAWYTITDDLPQHQELG
ncbi:GFA family protein [Dyella flagellata]|uniref:Aldehyde-activating protein n=1 Tax=Dyella flagellata TaxID=1867833 RepID=A0ABQ5XCB3_9GAMM|nr:GFA family protein [Dyella flagellata]GLQ88884.1 aldehyde-activating protein [Dyella flagellata]